MSKKFLISLLSVLVLSATVVMAEDTTTTTSRPQPPQFENGTSSDFNSNGGNFTKGKPPQMNGEKGQNGKYGGRRPSKKPDSKPGGDKTPSEWDTSSNNTQDGQNFQGGQPPQFNGNNSNNRPPMPPKQDTSSEN